MVRTVRAAIVGASTLVGKELAEQMEASTSVLWKMVLLEEGELAGRVTSAGDQAAVTLPIEADSFERMDVVFFAGDPESTRSRWLAARAAGALVIDVLGALEGEPGVLVGSPFLPSRADDRAAAWAETRALMPAHPVAVLLGLLVQAMAAGSAAGRLDATVLEPASQAGAAGVDEMHAQTVALLNFGAVPSEVYDAQVAFAVRDSLGAASRVRLGAITERVERQLAGLLGDEAGRRVSLQLLQAPVFHGYGASVLVQVKGGLTEAEAREMFSAPGLTLITEIGESGEATAPVAGEPGVHVTLRFRGGAQDERQERFWLWVTADNLRLAAVTAIGCAEQKLNARARG